MRIVLLIPTLDRSGAEKQFSLLASRLPRDEFDVRVIALTRGGPYAEVLQAAGIPVTVLGKRFRFDPFVHRRLQQLLAELKPDLLHTWLFAGNAYGRLAAGPNPRYPVIVSERCVDTWKARWQLWVDRKLAPRTTRLIGNSQSVADFYRNQGFPTERMGVIPNGIDLPTLATGVREEVRRELAIPAEARVVTYVGRLAAQKRVDDLIWAFELIREMQYADVHFLIAGDGPLRENLKRFADSLQMGPRIHFLGQRSDPLRLMAGSDLFWLASDFEGLSNSVMEAMASGLPVVASDIPPNRELVIPGETGFLVPVGDRIAFAQFANRILNDPTLGERLGVAGRERIRTEFSIDRMVEAYARLYREVAAAPGPSTKSIVAPLPSLPS
jgi:glycosyltransferase involved in cell wall biosynthesis